MGSYKTCNKHNSLTMSFSWTLTYKKEAKRKQIKESNTPTSLEKGSATGSLTISDEETHYTMKEPKNIRLNFLKS